MEAALSSSDSEDRVIRNRESQVVITVLQSMVSNLESFITAAQCKIEVSFSSGNMTDYPLITQDQNVTVSKQCLASLSLSIKKRLVFVLITHPWRTSIHMPFNTVLSFPNTVKCHLLHSDLHHWLVAKDMSLRRTSS